MTKEENRCNAFLKRNGRRVHEVIEVKAGDILGITRVRSIDVELNYVERVHQNPAFHKFDYLPYAVLKGPYIGFPVSGEL